MMIAYLNQNGGSVTALSTMALLLVTGWYAWTTRAMLVEAQRSRLLASEPRVVAYLRVHEVHSNIVQLCIANLSSAAATGVSGSISKATEWPERFDLEDSKILRDLSFLGPHEVLRFDLGAGPDLYKESEPARFHASINFGSLDGRRFSFKCELKIESVSGFSSWQIYGVDDIARRLEDIAKTLSSFTGFRRLKVETFSAADREQEERLREEQREQIRRRQTIQSDVGSQEAQ